MSRHCRAYPERTLRVLGELLGGTLGVENGPRYRTRTHSQELAPCQRTLGASALALGTCASARRLQAGLTSASLLTP